MEIVSPIAATRLGCPAAASASRSLTVAGAPSTATIEVDATLGRRTVFALSFPEVDQASAPAA